MSKRTSDQGQLESGSSVFMQSLSLQAAAEQVCGWCFYPQSDAALGGLHP